MATSPYAMAARIAAVLPPMIHALEDESVWDEQADRPRDERTVRLAALLAEAATLAATMRRDRAPRRYTARIEEYG